MDAACNKQMSLQYLYLKPEEAEIYMTHNKEGGHREFDTHKVY